MVDVSGYGYLDGNGVASSVSAGAFVELNPLVSEHIGALQGILNQGGSLRNALFAVETHNESMWTDAGLGGMAVSGGQTAARNSAGFQVFELAVFGIATWGATSTGEFFVASSPQVARLNANQALSRSSTAIRSAAQPLEYANSAANGVRLRTQLAFEEAGMLNSEGRLTAQALDSSIDIVPGSQLVNSRVIAGLTRNGTRIEDWAKFTTRSVNINGRGHQIHFYRHGPTGTVNYNIEFKVNIVAR